MHESPMHGFGPESERLARLILDYVIDRLRQTPPPLDGPRTPQELRDATGADDHRAGARARRRAGPFP